MSTYPETLDDVTPSGSSPAAHVEAEAEALARGEGPDVAPDTVAERDRAPRVLTGSFLDDRSYPDEAEDDEADAPEPGDEPDDELEAEAETEDEDGAEDGDSASDEDLDPEEKSARFHQSRADRLQTELDQIKEQNKLFEETKPVLDLLINDPAVLAYAEAKANGQPGAQQLLNGGGQAVDNLTPSPGGSGVGLDSRTSPNGAAIAPPEKPVRPEKPADYNEFDALNDPESDSYRYKQAEADYVINAADYGMRLNTYHEQLAEQQRQAQQRQQQEQAQYRAFITEQRDKAVTADGLPAQYADEFIQWQAKVNDAEALRPLLVRAFMVEKGGANGGRQSAKARAQKPKPPATPTAAAAASARTASPNGQSKTVDSFF